MGLSAAILLAFAIAGLPLLAWTTKRRLDEGLVYPKSAFYLQSIVLQLFLFVWAAAVARSERLRLAPDRGVDLREIGAALLLLAVALAAMQISWRLSDNASRERLLMIVPGTGRERLLWVGVSAAAALGEELLFRGVLFAILTGLLGSWLVAAMIAAVAFGLAHSVQGWTNAIHVALFGFAFHLLVVYSGDLWGAIAVHFIYDVTAGFVLGSKIRS